MSQDDSENVHRTAPAAGTAELAADLDSPATPIPKKKNRKKKKSSAQKQTSATDSGTAGAHSSSGAKTTHQKDGNDNEGAASKPIRIARNKHWRYVSSFHGQWLSLPPEVLASLFTSNMTAMPLHPASALVNDPSLAASPAANGGSGQRRSHLDPRRSEPASAAGKASNTSPNDPSSATIPPPIDPGVFRSLRDVRRLVDEATELSLRASSGLVDPGSASSSRAYGGLGPASSYFGGHNPTNPPSNPGGRKSTLSTIRANRMRVQAVQRLAEAYRVDEVATCVVIMKGTSAIDDLAERVLKLEPDNLDAQYVQFFHEKIPSSPRTLYETTTEPLDDLIAARPACLEFYRTRGIVHGFLDSHDLAIRDFTYALQQARLERKKRRARQKEEQTQSGHDHAARPAPSPSVGKAFEPAEAEEDAEPAVDPTVPTPLETQTLFLRASAYLANAVYTIEQTVLGLEDNNMVSGGNSSPSSPLYASTLPPDLLTGGIGKGDGSNFQPSARWTSYRHALNDNTRLRESVFGMLRKSVRDFEKFLAQFESIMVPEATTTPATASTSNAGLVPSSHPPAPYGHMGSPADLVTLAEGYMGFPNPSTTSSAPSKWKGKQAASNVDHFFDAQGGASIPIPLPADLQNQLAKLMMGAAAPASNGAVGGTKSSSPRAVVHTSNTTSRSGVQSVEGSAFVAVPISSKNGSSTTTNKDATTHDQPVSAAIANALRDALRSQLGATPLGSSLLSQLPAAAAKAIDASIQQIQSGTLIPPTMNSQSLVYGANGQAEGGVIAPPPPPPKWEDVPLPKQVGFSLFVTDCLRMPAGWTNPDGAGPKSPIPNPHASKSPFPDIERSFPIALTTYHPLLLEAHFSVLIALLMLGDSEALLERLIKAAVNLDGADGYPLFATARSIAQADFNEILEQMCARWKSQPTPAQASDPIPSSSTSSYAQEASGSKPAATSYVGPDNVDSEERDGPLQAIQILLDAVRDRVKRLQRTTDKNNSFPLTLLCSPRVDIVLAWLAVVSIPRWEEGSSSSITDN